MSQLSQSPKRSRQQQKQQQQSQQQITQLLKKNKAIQNENDILLQTFEKLQNELEKQKNNTEEMIQNTQSDLDRIISQLTAIKKNTQQSAIEKLELQKKIGEKKMLIKHLETHLKNITQSKDEEINRFERDRVVHGLLNIREYLHMIISKLNEFSEHVKAKKYIQHTFDRPETLSLKSSHQQSHKRFYSEKFKKFVEIDEEIKSKMNEISKMDVIGIPEVKYLNEANMFVIQEIKNSEKQIIERRKRDYKIAQQTQNVWINEKLKRIREDTNQTIEDATRLLKNLKIRGEDFERKTEEVNAIQEDRLELFERELQILNKRLQQQLRQHQNKTWQRSTSEWQARKKFLLNAGERDRKLLQNLFHIVTENYADELTERSNAIRAQQQNRMRHFRELKAKAHAELKDLSLAKQFQTRDDVITYDIKHHTETNILFMWMQGLFCRDDIYINTNTTQMFNSFVRALLISRVRRTPKKYVKESTSNPNKIVPYEFTEMMTVELLTEVLNDVIYPFDINWIKQHYGLNMNSLHDFNTACEQYDLHMYAIYNYNRKNIYKGGILRKNYLEGTSEFVSYFDEAIHMHKVGLMADEDYANVINLSGTQKHLMKSSPYVNQILLTWVSQSWHFKDSPFSKDIIRQRYDYIYPKYFFNVMLRLLTKYGDFFKTLSVYYYFVLKGIQDSNGNPYYGVWHESPEVAVRSLIDSEIPALPSHTIGMLGHSDYELFEKEGYKGLVKHITKERSSYLEQRNKSQSLRQQQTRANRSMHQKRKNSSHSISRDRESSYRQRKRRPINNSSTQKKYIEIP